MKKMRIALDAMGGDGGSEVLVKGAELAVDNFQDLEVVLVGKTELLTQILDSNGNHRERISVVHATEVVTMDESPKESLRKRNSSLAVSVRMVHEGLCDGMVSAGNTGATLAHTLTSWRTIKGLKRPAIATCLPTHKDPVILIDAGANVDCRPEHLLEFAIMGSLYAGKVLGRPDPRVGLISIGEEVSKGNRLTFQAQKLLQDAPVNFCGNAEGRDILSGNFDVAVCDGFIGNILLKFGEAAAELVMSNFLESLSKNGFHSSGMSNLKPVLKELSSRLHYAEYGGAPLLGVEGIAIISHGQSNPTAIMNAIKVACELVDHDINKHIREALENLFIYSSPMYDK